MSYLLRMGTPNKRLSQHLSDSLVIVALEPACFEMGFIS